MKAKAPVLLGAPGSAEELAEVSRLASSGVGAMGLLSLVATLLIRLSSAPKHLRNYHPLPVVLLSVAAIAVFVVGRRRPALLSPRTLPYLIPVGTVAVGAVALFASADFSPFAAMFLVWVGAGVTFMPRRTAAVLIAWSGVVYAFVLTAQPGNAIPVARWELLLGLSVTLAAGLDRIEVRARALVVSESEAHLLAEEARGRLEEVSSERTRFLAGMSHQLRTPLNAIIGFSDVLAQGRVGPLNDKQAEYASDVVDSGRHLLSLVDDLLDLAKIESGVLELDVTSVDVVGLLTSSAALFREQAGRRQLTLTVDVLADVDHVDADERKLRQVLFNLVSNAVKFTPPGGEIRLLARTDGDAVEIAVTDTGSGIASGELTTIFEEYAQAGANAGTAGTGLGLPLARRLIEAHGGRLWAESDGRNGATFLARVPLCPTPSTVPAAPVTAAAIPAGRSLLGEEDSPERRLETARAMLLVGSGIAFTALVSVLFFWLYPVPEFTDHGHLGLYAGMEAVAIAVCVATWRFPLRLGAPRFLPFLIPGMAAAFGVSIYAAGVPFSPYILMASAATAIAGALIGRATGFAAVAVSAGVGAILFATQAGNSAPAARWLLITGFTAVTAMLHRRFIWRIALLAEAERAAREDAERVADALAVASRHKTEFLANMSHELRTPLNAIIGFSEVLAGEAFGPLNTKQREYVNDVYTSGRHLLELINDILDLAKLEAGRMDLERQPVDVAATIAAAARSIDVTIEVDGELGVIDADEGKLRRAIGSLLTNAAKFAPDGGRVALRASRRGGDVEIVVTDNGPGVPAAEQERVFEAFIASGPEQGSGLGLALARRYAELHGGTLTLSSRPGAGATFTLRVPDAQAPTRSFNDIDGGRNRNPTLSA